MKPPMLHTCYKVTTSRNSYGDYTASGQTAIDCHFRYINQQISDSNNQVIQSDAMLWVEPDSGIDRKTIIKFEGEHFIVEKVTKARRLRETDVQFLKCDLKKYGVIS